MSLDKRVTIDYLVKAGIVVASSIALLPIFHLIGEAFYRGGSVIFKTGVKFFTETPPPPGTQTYGILTSLAGTLELALLSAAIGVPVAFMAALLSVEFPKSLAGRLVRVLSRALLEIPTILIGMFVFIVLLEPMGTPSILSGVLALSIVILPYVTIYVESALGNIPSTYREAGFALGMSRFQVSLRVMIPIAGRGIVTGILLGIAKVMGETAPLLFTLGRARSMLNLNPLGPGDAIPLLIYDYAMAPYSNMREVAWGAALVLITILLVLQILSRRLIKEVRL